MEGELGCDDFGFRLLPGAVPALRPRRPFQPPASYGRSPPEDAGSSRRPKASLEVDDQGRHLPYSTVGTLYAVRVRTILIPSE